MTALIIFAVVIAIGLLLYFKSPKKNTKGGQGGKEEENYQDPTKPIYK